MSAYGYDSGPGRYSDGEWERTRQEALDARDCEPSPQRAEPGRSPSTLVPGVVRMSLRGNLADVEQVIAAIERSGAKVFRGDSPGTKGGNRAGFRYFTVKVRDDRDG